MRINIKKQNKTKQKQKQTNKKKPSIMTVGLINSWQIEGEKVEAVIYLIFLGFKITLYSDCSHEIKGCFPLGKKQKKKKQKKKKKKIWQTYKAC